MTLWIEATPPCEWCAVDMGQHWHSVRREGSAYVLGVLIRTDRPPVEDTLRPFTQEPHDAQG